MAHGGAARRHAHFCFAHHRFMARLPSTGFHGDLAFVGSLGRSSSCPLVLVISQGLELSALVPVLESLSSLCQVAHEC